MKIRMAAMQRDYTAKLAKMQATLDLMLKGKVMQSATETYSRPDSSKRQLPESTPNETINKSNQDIGEALIFDPNEKTDADGGSNPTSSLSDASKAPSSGFGIGGRAPLDITTQGLNTTNTALGQSFNPDIMVAGDFIGHYADRHGMPDRNRVALREAEFGFSAAIDPYAKGTFIFSKPDNGPLDVEEGYVTLLDLPWGLQAKVGQMRSPFGKINVLHTHDLPQTDRPDVYTNFFGDDGLIESGVAVSKILPTPWYSSLDAQVANGDTLPFFGHGRITKPLTIAHWKNFIDLTNTQSVEIGASGAIGAEGPADMAKLSHVEGIDVTYHWIPPSQFHALIWQTELLAAQREHPPIGGKNDLLGGYSFMEYKLNQRWNVGIRLDYSQTPLIANASSWAIAPYVNFWQSEFGRARLEFKHTFGDGRIPSSNQIWAQYDVILGLHPPHTF